MRKWKEKMYRHWQTIIDAMSSLDWEGPSRIR
jgi:hypothetical protein